MGRPLKTQSEGMTDRILAAATHLFATRGFGATSLQMVADEVGVRKQSLLYHFRSKDDLRRRVLENLLQQWNDVLPQLLMAVSGGEDRVEAIIRTVLGFFAEDPDRARLLKREAIDRPAAIRTMLRGQTRWLETICDTIRLGQKEGIIYEDVDPEPYVVGIIHLMIDGVGAHAAMGAFLDDKDPPDALERYTKELLRFAKAGLFKDGWEKSR